MLLDLVVEPAGRAEIAKTGDPALVEWGGVVQVASSGRLPAGAEPAGQVPGRNLVPEPGGGWVSGRRCGGGAIAGVGVSGGGLGGGQHSAQGRRQVGRRLERGEVVWSDDDGDLPDQSGRLVCSGAGGAADAGGGGGLAVRVGEDDPPADGRVASGQVG